MLIELSQLPQIVQQHILSQNNEVIQIVNNGQVIKTIQFGEPNDEDAYYEHFHQHHFDIERMKQAIGETDENGCAKHTTAIPKGLASDFEAFNQWMLERSLCK